MSPSSGIPLQSILFTITVTLLLSLISVGSPVAFNDVVSLTISALYGSYLSACSLLLWRRCQGHIHVPKEDHLGKDFVQNLPGSAGRLTWGPWRVKEPFGTIINAIACAYLIIALIFSFFPPATPVTPDTMNYSILVFGTVVLGSVVYYVVIAHRTYDGPVIEVSERE